MEALLWGSSCGERWRRARERRVTDMAVVVEEAACRRGEASSRVTRRLLEGAQAQKTTMMGYWWKREDGFAGGGRGTCGGRSAAAWRTSRRADKGVAGHSAVDVGSGGAEGWSPTVMMQVNALRGGGTRVGTVVEDDDGGRLRRWWLCQRRSSGARWRRWRRG